MSAIRRFLTALRGANARARAQKVRDDGGADAARDDEGAKALSQQQDLDACTVRGRHDGPEAKGGEHMHRQPEHLPEVPLGERGVALLPSRVEQEREEEGDTLRLHVK